MIGFGASMYRASMPLAVSLSGESGWAIGALERLLGLLLQERLIGRKRRERSINYWSYNARILTTTSFF
jgi:hypothetical protein